jgi:hypothetical protein
LHGAPPTTCSKRGGRRKPRYSLLDDDFISLVSVIEAAVQVMGEKLVTDPERQDAYRQARKMAHEGNAAIEPISAVAA